MNRLTSEANSGYIYVVVSVSEKFIKYKYSLYISQEGIARIDRIHSNIVVHSNSVSVLHRFRSVGIEISCHHCTMSEDDDIVMMTENFRCENTISEFLPFSTGWPNKKRTFLRYHILQPLQI